MSQTVLQNDLSDIYVDVSGVYGNLFIGITEDEKIQHTQQPISSTTQLDTNQKIKPKTIHLKNLDLEQLIGKKQQQKDDAQKQQQQFQQQFQQQQQFQKQFQQQYQFQFDFGEKQCEKNVVGSSLLPTNHMWFEVGSLNPQLAEDFVVNLMKDSCSRLSYSRQLQQRLETEETKVFKLMSCFPKRAVDASNQLKLCQTLIKKYCRQCGMPRWPQRKIRALDTSLQQSEKVLKKLPKDPLSYNQQHQISLKKYEDTLEQKHIIYDQFLANYYAREFEFRRGGREKFRQKRLENEQRLQMLRQQSLEQEQEKAKKKEQDQEEQDCSQYLLDDFIDINNFTDLLVPFGDWTQNVGEKRKR